MSTLHIHAPQPTRIERRRIKCPTCQRRTFIGALYEWYGWLITCLHCGDRWQDGERMPRPFAPGWRKDNVRRARKLAESKC